MAQTFPTKRGDTVSLLFRFKEPSGEVSPLDGVSFRMHVKNASGETVAQLSSQVGGGLEVDLAAGTVTASIPASITDDFLLQKHYTDLELTYPSGDVHSSETVILKIEEDFTV